MRGQGVASQRPVRAVVGAAKHAAVGRDHDRARSTTVSACASDRALRHRLSDGPPAPALIVACGTPDPPPPTRGGRRRRIEGQRLDAARRQPFAARLPAESRIGARPRPPAGQRIHLVRALARHRHAADVVRLRARCRCYSRTVPSRRYEKTALAREIDTSADAARRRAREPASSRTVTQPFASDRRRSGRLPRRLRRARAGLDVEDRRERGSREDVRRHHHPVASAVTRAGDARVRRQQQVMRIRRADGQGQRAAHEAAGIDVQPRGAGIARAEQTAPATGIVGRGGARREPGRRARRRGRSGVDEMSSEKEGPGQLARAPRVGLPLRF